MEKRLPKTGESISVNKISDSIKGKVGEYSEAKNIGFSSTDVIKGSAKAIVIATGTSSEIGKISKLTLETRHESEFEKGISRFSNFILKLVIITILLVLIANVFIKHDSFEIIELVVFSIALTISVIPEALPLIITFSLSKGARKLAEQKVVVKRLSAVEDMGGIEVLCSDKTGTLTKNELSIANILGEDSSKVLYYSALTSVLTEKDKHEPFDRAIWQSISKDLDSKLKKAKVISEQPFDPEFKYNSVVIQVESKKEVIYRGAPEILMECSDLTSKNKKEILEWIKREGEQGHRVLAVASQVDDKLPSADIRKTKNLEFHGVISFVDKLKPSAFRAVNKAKSLGVQIKILTGDSSEVAGAIAHEIKLIDSPQEVMVGSEWAELTQKEKLKMIDNFHVFARVSPQQKFEIVELLNSKYSVGFLGEGINDAPALKLADVSIVVDSAADIAREAADVILLKQNLLVILEGIKEGRIVFANTTKYIKATLSSNFGNFFAIAMASLLVSFLPMLPVQILLVNLLSDLPLVSLSTDTVDEDELVIPEKYNLREIILFSASIGVVSSVFDFIVFGMFFMSSPKILQTNWFMASILTEIILIFSIRTKRFFVKTAAPSKTIMILSAAVFVITTSLPFTSFGQSFFHFIQPSTQSLISVFVIVISYFVVTEIVKLFFYSKNNLQVVE